ncbi:MAG: tripartite tricarboxylate transporter TctB family protein [Rhodospirillales bacterium]|jgi:predicted small integral membrane protein|nr:tripartite tricarboxylate transporter TctB family protein [Rhodospirillales bacterium]
MPAKPDRDTPGIILAAVFILLAAVFVFDSRNLLDPDSYVFPMAICTVMIVLSIGFIVWNVIRPQPDPEASPSPGSTPRRVGLVLVMLASAFLMPYAGFLLAGLGVFAALMLLAMFEPWTPKRGVLYAIVGVAIVTGFYVLFAKIFLVPLPETPFL